MPNDSTSSGEVHRFESVAFEDTDHGLAFVRPCVRCDREVVILWNGGELDEKTCRCGLRYAGVHVRTDVVAIDPSARP